MLWGNLGWCEYTLSRISVECQGNLRELWGEIE